MAQCLLPAELELETGGTTQISKGQGHLTAVPGCSSALQTSPHSFPKGF